MESAKEECGRKSVGDIVAFMEEHGLKLFPGGADAIEACNSGVYKQYHLGAQAKNLLDNIYGFLQKRENELNGLHENTHIQETMHTELRSDISKLNQMIGNMDNKAEDTQTAQKELCQNVQKLSELMKEFKSTNASQLNAIQKTIRHNLCDVMHKAEEAAKLSAESIAETSNTLRLTKEALERQTPELRDYIEKHFKEINNKLNQQQTICEKFETHTEKLQKKWTTDLKEQTTALNKLMQTQLKTYDTSLREFILDQHAKHNKLLQRNAEEQQSIHTMLSESLIVQKSAIKNGKDITKVLQELSRETRLLKGAYSTQTAFITEYFERITNLLRVEAQKRDEEARKRDEEERKRDANDRRNGILLYAGAATFLFLLVPPVTAGITFIAANGAVAAMDRLAGDDNGDNDD